MLHKHDLYVVLKKTDKTKTRNKTQNKTNLKCKELLNSVYCTNHLKMMCTDAPPPPRIIVIASCFWAHQLPVAKQNSQLPVFKKFSKP